MRTIKKALFAIISLILIANPLSAAETGITVSGTHTDGEETGTLELRLVNEAVRMDFKTSEEDVRILFHQKPESIWIIDNNEKSALQITRRDIEKIKELLDSLQAELQAIPAAHRAMIENQIKQQMPISAEPEKLQYSLVERGEKIRSWTADRYRVANEKGERKGEIWTVSWADIDIQEKDFQVLESLAEFLGLLSDDITFYLPLSGEKTGEFKGFLVEAVSYRNDKIHQRTSITDVMRGELDKSLFEVPANVKVERIELPD